MNNPFHDYSKDIADLKAQLHKQAVDFDAAERKHAADITALKDEISKIVLFVSFAGKKKTKDAADAK